MADNIENAFSLEVVGGDFFGTGRINRKIRSGLLVDHDWEFKNL